MLKILLDIIKYGIFMHICIVDIKKKIISEAGFIILMFIGFQKALSDSSLTDYYLGICTFSLPLLILYIVEDYIKKEIIGFGDIKLMMAVGGIFKYRNIREIMEFYLLLYILSGIAVCFLLLYFKYKKKKSEYVPFAPFIIVSHIVFGYLGRNIILF
ncbi:prepilin peptidase [Leptotrichia sp. OH3620_COT-345]|uniref:prepilin peptidase n=1 Tax=Leptotrichia sp. OH3620_COT-345 TaxID=2491048 RepID=UPI000F64A921|nr:prepilin peptidase [Leptotrichia sp. OH3620_COT-345]RRD39352.1 prepilin peptidase [Leptotrichia sp. OH3620_COT-345]